MIYYPDMQVRYRQNCRNCQKDYCGGVELICIHCNNICHMDEEGNICMPMECVPENGHEHHYFQYVADIIPLSSQQNTETMLAIFNSFAPSQLPMNHDIEEVMLIKTSISSMVPVIQR